MPKIGNIGLDAVLSDGDKLLGTDSGGQTKNFSLRQLRNFMAENSGVFKHVQTFTASSLNFMVWCPRRPKLRSMHSTMRL